MSETLKLININEAQIKEKGVQSLSNRPNSFDQYGVGGLSPAQLKARFDKLAAFLADKINELQNTISSEEAADYIRVVLDDYNVENLGDLVASFKDGTFAENILQVSPYAGDDTKASLQSVLNNIAQDLSHDNEEIGNIWSICVTNIEIAINDFNNTLLIRLLNRNGESLIEQTIDMTVKTTRIEDGAVTSDKLAQGCVKGDKIYQGAVTDDKIAKDTIKERSLHNDLKYLIKNSFNSVEYDPETGKLTFKSENGRNQIVDLPLELITSGGYYDDTEGSESVVLVLANKQEIRIPVEKLLYDSIGKIGIVQEIGNDERKVMSQKATTEAINNASALCANALKGNKSGSTVVITDVSPVEHTIDCKVILPEIVPSESVSDAVYQLFAEATYGDSSSISAYSGIAEGTPLKLVKTNPNAQYFLYVDGAIGVQSIDFDGDTYKFNAPSGYFAIAYDTWEIAEVVSEHVLYLDLPDVKVKRYGKNLCELGTVTFTKGADYVLEYPITCVGKSVRFSANIITTDTDREKVLMYIYDKDGAQIGTGIGLSKDENRTGFRSSIFINKPTANIAKIRFYASNGADPATGDTATFKDIQIELASSDYTTDLPTTYEPFVVPTDHAVNADGTVDGITSVYPNVILFADTAGVTLDVTYNRDINKAFAELQNAIISTGGNV